MTEPTDNRPRPSGGSLPKYRQVEEDLRYRILSGQWKQGDQIPTEAELCLQYDVSRITIRRAIQNLAMEGYLYSLSGKGTFVGEWEAHAVESPMLRSFTNEMHDLGYRAVTASVELDLAHADARLAAVLDIAPGDRVVELRRVRAIQSGAIIAYSINSYPYSHEFSADPRDYFGSLYGYLQQFGIYFTSAREYLEATLPPVEVAQRLQLEPVEPVLKSVKVSRNASRTFAEHNVCYYVGSRYRYYITH